MSKIPTRRKPVPRGPFSLRAVVPAAVLAAVPLVQIRAPVLGPPKQPPFAQPHVPMGSPYALLFPPAVVTEPRQPVLGPAKTLPSVPGFLQSSPLTLIGAP